MTIGPRWSVCPSCFQYLSDGQSHYCPGPMPQIYTWPPVKHEKPHPIEGIIVTFDPAKELPGTVILMDGVYYMKLALTEEVNDPYDWYSDEGMAYNASMMDAREVKAEAFEFLKRPRTSKREVLKRLIDHKDIDKAIEELKSTIDTEDK